MAISLLPILLEAVWKATKGLVMVLFYLWGRVNPPWGPFPPHAIRWTDPVSCGRFGGTRC